MISATPAAFHGVIASRKIAQSHANRSDTADVLETERWVRRISFEELKALVGKRANATRQRLVTLPEARGGVMFQRGRERPA